MTKNLEPRQTDHRGGLLNALKPGAMIAVSLIIREKGGEYNLLFGGASRNVCTGICKPLIEDAGMTLGGPTFPGRADKTPFRIFFKL